MKCVISGHGRMGKMIEDMLLEAGDEILGIVDIDLFQNPADIPGKADVLIDFSHPDFLEMNLKYARETGCNMVIGTTGLDGGHLNMIREASKSVGIIQRANYSLGVYVLTQAVKMAAPSLKSAGFDIEIVETHHNKKVDSPSGTAKLLLDAADPEGYYERVYGREGMVGARGKEIGVHAIRGGTVAGEHSVYFFGDDEILEFKHSASSRRIFASGAVRAARFMVGKPAGLYDLGDVLKI
ncbi:MAG: 4-hydroxy-tetrahydrodipicolinate reductase [Clostridia bacterium]|nr:4-hydroxy-tetrahydrodipicolinate reductase [Clostridia bacterium]